MVDRSWPVKKIQHRYEYIVDGEVIDRLTLKDFEELIECMKINRQFQPDAKNNK